MAAAVLRRVWVEMRPEGGKTVRDTDLSRGQGAETAGSVIAAECSRCEVLVARGACWATVVAAAGTSAEPVPPSEGTAKHRSESGVGGR